MGLTIKIRSKEQEKYDIELKVKRCSTKVDTALTFTLVNTIQSILNKLNWGTEESSRFVTKALIKELEKKILKKEDIQANLSVLLWGERISKPFRK